MQTFYFLTWTVLFRYVLAARHLYAPNVSKCNSASWKHKWSKEKERLCQIIAQLVFNHALIFTYIPLAPSIITTHLAVPHLQTQLPNFPQIIGQMALANAHTFYTPDMKLSVI